jgi:hypothetical protein
MIQLVRDAAKIEFREHFMRRADATYCVVAQTFLRRFCNVLKPGKIAGGMPALPEDSVPY